VPKASKAVAASRSRSSRLNLAIAVAEVSEDRILFASPGSEAELVINPVVSVESVVYDVSSKLGSAMRQFEKVRKTYRYSGLTQLTKWIDATNDTGRPTMVGRVSNQNVGRHQQVLQHVALQRR